MKSGLLLPLLLLPLRLPMGACRHVSASSRCPLAGLTPALTGDPAYKHAQRENTVSSVHAAPPGRNSQLETSLYMSKG